MRICLVYDCLFPHTVGGAERWYRNLAQRLAADGHEVTYLTLRQWPRGRAPATCRACDVVAVGPADGALPPGRAAADRCPRWCSAPGVLRHLLRHGRRYDVVHTASFPYFSLLAAAARCAARGRFRLVVDWHEVWTRDYWREYLGRSGGRVGWAVQALCLRVPPARVLLRAAHAERLRGGGRARRGHGARGRVRRAARRPPRRCPARPGRRVRRPPHPGEARARRRAGRRAARASGCPSCAALIFGDGPGARARCWPRSRRPAWRTSSRRPGSSTARTSTHDLARALCMVLPSRARGLRAWSSSRRPPSARRASSSRGDRQRRDRAGRGGRQRLRRRQRVAGGPRRRDRARARAPAATLRASTAGWFGRNARRLSLDSSLDVVARSYTA